MSELETLRPEVRRAFMRADHWKRGDRSWEIIRAELLRLVGDLNATRLSIETFEAKYRCMRERAERAEAELAALKERIADSPVASVRVDDRMHVSIGARSNAVDFVPLHTKRVRLVVEE